MGLANWLHTCSGPGEGALWVLSVQRAVCLLECTEVDGSRGPAGDPAHGSQVQMLMFGDIPDFIWECVEDV